MFQSLRIKQFRGITDLSIDNLDHVNIITGKNNAGKTALLEALFLHCSGVNPGLALVVNAMRGLERFGLENSPGSEMPWDSVFPNYDRTCDVEISTKDKDGTSRITTLKVERPKSALIESLSIRQVADVLVMESDDSTSAKKRVELTIEKNGPKIDPVLQTVLNATYVAARRGSGPSEDASRYGKLEIEKREGILVEALKVIEPRLSRIAVIVTAGEGILYGDVGTGRLLPLPIMGEGMSRLATIILTLAVSRDGVVLIDEIENGFHYSVLEAVWRAIGKVARQLYVQVFATTHSHECVEAAHLAFKGSTPYDLRIHRIEHSDHISKVATYDQETIEAALNAKLEIR